MRRRFLLACIATVCLTHGLLADAFAPVSLSPISHNTAALIVVSADGKATTYSPADLERLPTFSMTTKTPWRDVPATFDGVLLSDLLAANGLDDVEEIVVTAENDYSTSLNRALLNDVRILVATRVDGRAHTRRERGPIQFVIERNEFEASDLTSEAHFVWMAARIEPARQD
jgi:hypothetical protein